MEGLYSGYVTLDRYPGPYHSRDHNTLIKANTTPLQFHEVSAGNQITSNSLVEILPDLGQRICQFNTGIKSSLCFCTLSPARFDEYSFTLTWETQITTWNEGGATGLCTDVFAVATLL
jgi:hypothetical protein